MRFITSKIWRAYPELDTFSDEECMLFVQRVRSSPAYQVLALGLCIAVFTVAFLAVAGVNMFWLSRIAKSSDSVILLSVAVIATLQFLVPALLMLGARDAFLRRRLKRIVGKAVCPQCRYSLLGQQTFGTAIRCPECGGWTSLKELGIRSPADLLPPETNPAPAHQ